MGIFSRRKGAAPNDTAADQTPADLTSADEIESDSASTAVAGPQDAADTAPAESAADDVSADAPLETAPAVSISMSSYRGLGAQESAASSASAAQAAASAVPAAPVRTAEELAPASAEPVAGLRENALLRATLGKLTDAPNGPELIDVARALLQGHVFLRVKGDARALIEAGDPLPLATGAIGDDQYVFAFSGGEAMRASLQADRDEGTSAMGQPVLSVLRHVLSGTFAGIILDPASGPHRAVLPRDLLERITAKMDTAFTIKTLLAGERTPETTASVVDALTRVPLWLALGTTAAGDTGVAEARSTDGKRYVEVYSHPLEVAAMRRGDKAAQITGAQLATALAGDTGLSGVVVDSAGPWMRIEREDLGPLLATKA